MYDMIDDGSNGYDMIHQSGMDGLHDGAGGLNHPLHVLHSNGSGLGDTFGADNLTADHSNGTSLEYGPHGDDLGSNTNMLMGYPDPLAHAAEYHPAGFAMDAQIDNQAGFADSMAAPNALREGDISYTMAVDGGIMPAVVSTDSFHGVENGMLTNPAGLDGLIAAGEVSGTHHIDAGDEHRSEAVKEEFLHSHGYANVPAGYELHHIVPLSEGGADDVHNMVLVPELEHQQITDAQRTFYGW